MQQTDHIKLVSEGLFVRLVAQLLLRDFRADPAANARKVEQGGFGGALFFVDRETLVCGKRAVGLYVDRREIGYRE